MRPAALRGHALLVVLAALTALAATAGVVWARISVDREGRMAEERRTQLLWLARGATTAGRPGTKTVLIAREQVKVNTRVWQLGSVARVASDASLSLWGTAHVEALLDRAGKVVDWRERYERVVVQPPSGKPAPGR
jgi:hypothetical protein